MKKPRIQPALASLTLAEREQLADWLRHEQYAVVLDRVKKPRPEGFNLNISDKPLRTFWRKIGLLDAINARLPADKKISLELFETLSTRDIYFLSSLDSKKLDEAHQAILNTSVDLATSGESTPTQLATLQRLIDFPARAEIRANKEERAQAKEERAQAKEERAIETHALKKEMHAHKIAYDNARLEIDKEALTLRREESARRASKTSPSPLQGERAGVRGSPVRRQAHDAALGITHYNDEGRPCDHLGPYATNWDEVGDRVCKQFGITREELIRRAELRRTWKNPNARPPHPEASLQSLESGDRTFPSDALTPQTDVSADLNSQLDPAQPSPTKNPVQNPEPETHSTLNHSAQSAQSPTRTDVPSASLDPAARNSKFIIPDSELHEVVDRYTVRRAQEYWAHRRTYTGWPHKQMPPEYITQYRHCPCGNPTPCPIHESEELGPFPDTFWKLSPHHGDYAASLTDRNLPYRNPTEYL